MKNKIKKFIVGALAAFMTIASAASTWATSPVFDFYKLDAPYEGSISVTVEAPLGEGKTQAIQNMEFKVYQVWTLNEAGEVEFDSTQPFEAVTDDLSGKTARELIEEMLDVQTAQPAGETYDLTYLLSGVASSAKPFTAYGTDSSLTTDSQGKIKATKLPFGGYLFVPGAPIEKVEPLKDGRTKTEKYSAAPFLASVPALVNKTGNENTDLTYTKDVNATAKVMALRDETITEIENFGVKLSKTDVAGAELPGATLRVYTVNGSLAKDKVSGETLQWKSTTEPRTVSLEPGTYCMVETAPPDTEKVKYYTAQPVWFNLDKEGKVSICRDANGKLADHNGNTLQGESIFEENDGRRRPDNVDAVIMVNEPRYEPDLKKSVETNATPENTFHGIVGDGEVYTYRITTQIPSNKKAFQVVDVLEPVLDWPANTPSGEEIGNAGIPNSEWVGVQIGNTRLTDEQLAEQITLDTVQVDGVERKRLTVDFTKAQLSKNAGDDVIIMFFAQVKPGADLTPYIVANGSSQVPNEAEYIIDNSYRKRSNPVTVSPPPKGRTSTSSSKPVKTGDENNMLLWIIVIAVAVSVLFIIIAMIRRRKSSEDAEE